MTTTTQALADRLTAVFGLRRPVMRLRNAPFDSHSDRQARSRDTTQPLRLVWHGFAVHLRGRGVDVILDAVSRCVQPVTLTLQGRLSDSQRALILGTCARLGIGDKVRFAPAAHPEAILASLVGHDVGVIGETGIDDNQRLTSSNKLFECIHAGLAVIAPDLPGLAETLDVEQVGVLYRPADAADLARAIDRLAADPTALRSLQRSAADAAPRLTWSADFAPVWSEVQTALPQAHQRAAVAAMHEARL